jgi:transposase
MKINRLPMNKSELVAKIYQMLDEGDDEEYIAEVLGVSEHLVYDIQADVEKEDDPKARRYRAKNLED